MRKLELRCIKEPTQDHTDLSENQISDSGSIQRYVYDHKISKLLFYK